MEGGSKCKKSQLSSVAIQTDRENNIYHLSKANWTLRFLRMIGMQLFSFCALFLAETQCSLPVQCTDKTEKQEALFKPQAKEDINRGAPCVTSVTPRGLGREEEDTSFDSLSKFNVKFPPTDNDSTFLHSTPERPNILGPVTSEAACQDKFNMEFRDNPGNFVKTEETLFEIQGIDPIASAIQNLKTTDKTKPSNLVNTCIRTTLDRAPCLPPGNHNALYVNTLPLQDPSDAPFASLDSPGKAIRGPQQVTVLH